jgi:hypothetical protein
VRGWWLAFLFLGGLGTALLAAAFQKAPGYMDADYYYAGGLNLVSGQGWSEPFLWNYLDDPQGLPHPAFTYWMPLASLIAAAGMWLGRSTGFESAQSSSILLTALLPPLTGWLAYSFVRQRWVALLAGLLAVLPGFYLPYLVTTDTFAVNMLLGIAWLQLLKAQTEANPDQRRAILLAFCMGLTAGMLHLARADGLLWLGLTLLALLVEGNRFAADNQTDRNGLPLARLGLPVLACLAGYLLIMGGWLARNLALYGLPLSPAGGRALWITNYDELFAYPAAILTPGRWWSSGLAAILGARLWALEQNLQTALAVQGAIFMVILVIPGAWELRGDVRVRWGVIAFGAIFVSMTLVFPYPGGRGGLFHSGATLQPLWWALAPPGLLVWLHWGERRRGWLPESARLALLLTVLISYDRLVGADPAYPTWGRSHEKYRRLIEGLGEFSAWPDEIALVNNPPGYYAATGRSAIPVPEGDLAHLLAAARRYRARYLLLERDHPTGLNALYQEPRDQPGLRYLATIGDTRLFEILEAR